MQTIQARLKELWGKIKEFFKKLNKRVRILLGVCLVVAIAVIIALAIRLNHKEYAVLFTNLTSNETSTVVKFLNDNGISDFRINNDTILVPAGREDQLQAQLILSGRLSDAYLNHSFYLTNSGALTTSEEQQRIAKIDMEQRLQAVIQNFNGVWEATVDIAPGTDRIYVLEDSATPTTAAVTITPSGNQELSEDVVRAIRYTVSHAVEGLKVEDVSISNTVTGNTYSDFESITNMTGQATALKLQYEEQIRNNVRREIFNGLSSIYGQDNVTVNVLCTVEVSHEIVDETAFRQPVGSVDGGGLIIGDHLFYELIRGDEGPVGGTPGTTTNSDLNGNFPNYPDLANGDDGNSVYQGEQVDREGVVDKINTQREVLEGRLKDLRILVTVNQNSKSAGSVAIDALRDTVASMAGLGGTEDALNRVSVLIAPFNDLEPDDPFGNMGIFGVLTSENSWIIYAAIGGLVLFVVLLVLIIVLSGRRRKQKRLQEQMTLEEEMAAAAMAAEAAALLVEAPPTGGADIMEVNTEKSMELRQEVRRFAQNNPEIAAQMVKAWLKGGDDNSG